MDSIITSEGPKSWIVVATDGPMLGKIEKRENGFAVLPSAGSQLADLDVPVFMSLEAARDGIGAHLQGECRIDEAGDAFRGER